MTARLSLLRRTAAAAALLLGASAALPVFLDAILVAPHAVFIDHRTRSAQVFLVNTSAQPEEVSLELKYGFADADSNGDAYVRLVDNPDSTMRSSAAWLRAFPRRTIVQPGERQAVRILAQPPLDLADGEYWSRLIVTSHPIQPPPAPGDTGVRVGITVELRTILPVQYRKGTLTTAVMLNQLQPVIRGDSAIIWMDLARGGNAAWVGTLHLDIHDSAGRVVGTVNSPLAVYFPARRRFAVPLTLAAPAPAGTPFTIRYRLSTDREDLRPAEIVPSPPVIDSLLVRSSP